MGGLLISRTSYQETQVCAPNRLVVHAQVADDRSDTAWYWNLTKHIFRYDPASEQAKYNGEHTVNEGTSVCLHLYATFCITNTDLSIALRADGLIDKIRFHTKWILNWDEAEF